MHDDSPVWRDLVEAAEGDQRRSGQVHERHRLGNDQRQSAGRPCLADAP